ncbi:MAG: glycosyltransferase family 4 protein [Bacteroidota bacterium]
MRKQKIAYIVSDIEKALAFEWIAQHLSSRYDLIFILIGKNETPLIKFLNEQHIRLFVIPEHKNTFKKWLTILSVLRKERPDIIHIHMWKAMILGLTASFLLGFKRRIFTRHYSVVHYIADPRGLKWDKLCNWLATDIVAISLNVRNVLINKDKATPSKIHLINHGFDLAYFEFVDEKLVNELRQKYNIPPGKGPVIGVISRYLELKGIQYIIPAFQKLREKYADAHLVLANTHGDYENQIKKQLLALPRDSYIEIRFERELAALYKLFTVFVHVPVDDNQEAFGQTYVEALAAGIPSVFSMSGVAPEFIIDKVNALVVPHRNSDAIESAITQILENPSLANSLTTRGKISVQNFTLETMLSKLEELYA